MKMMSGGKGRSGPAGQNGEESGLLCPVERHRGGWFAVQVDEITAAQLYFGRSYPHWRRCTLFDAYRCAGSTHARGDPAGIDGSYDAFRPVRAKRHGQFATSIQFAPFEISAPIMPI